MMDLAGAYDVTQGPPIDSATAKVCAEVVEKYVNQTKSDLILFRLPDGRYALSIAERDS